MERNTTRLCLNCNSPLTSARAKKFCNNTCQQQNQRRIRYQKVETSGATCEHQMKCYLLDKYGNVCMDVNCAWDFNKRPINVELEHIDGNATNNTIANCLLLCPNCHSTTATYKAKNKGNGKRSR